MMIRNKVLTTAIAASCCALMLGLAGCGSKSPDDQALMTQIQSKLYADPVARTANVKVGVVNGVVTLTGDVPTPDVALQVVNLANSTSGIKSVDNELKVATGAATPSMGSTPPAAATPLAQNTPPPPPPVQARPLPPPVREQRALPREPLTATVPPGTDIGVRMIDGISSKTNTSGQTFRASLSSPVVVDGNTVLPSGSDATVLLSNSKGAGRIKGSSELEVRLVSIASGGHSYDVDTSVHEEVGKGRGKQTAVRSGIGAAAGAVIGAIAGGGKGAAIGSLAGGGAGAGFQLATHGQQVSIPSETRLTFRLQSPLVVTLRGARP